MATTLSQLARSLQEQGLLLSEIPTAWGGIVITGCDCDSRLAAADHLFVCKGVHFREDFLSSALERGAVAYLCEEERAQSLATIAPGIPALVTVDIRRAMNLVAPLAWEHPDHALTCVGITGTKGKTTTSYLLRSILDGEQVGARVALMGSVETYDGIERLASLNTTPESPDLWRHLANARTAGLPYLVTEVSSQALKYGRVAGLGLDIACFLNIGRDHISAVEHPTLEDYFQSKLRIFAQARHAVVNLGTQRCDEVLAAAAVCEKLTTFSVAGPESGADIWAQDIRAEGFGLRFFAHTPAWEGELALPMPGDFNVENALCAIAVCHILGIGQEQVASGLAHAQVPGRMEVTSSADGKITGIVDFAHNQMAFRRFFPAVREQFPGRPIISVFGAVGSKAVERRKELPEEAAKWSDLLIFTEDDPGSEPVADICAAMVEATPAGTPTETVLDREEAVRRAVEVARAMDGPVVICLLCRGTETTQHRDGVFVPVKLDTEIMREALA